MSVITELLNTNAVFRFSALAEQEDFTKYIPQPEFIDDYGKVS